MGRSLSPILRREMENLDKDAHSRRSAMKALKSYMKELDSKPIPMFLAQVSQTKETGSLSGECTISLYEVLARVHGVKIVPQINSIMATIIKTLASSAGSFPLQQACSKVVPAIARYGIHPTTPEDKKRNIIHSLCKPLSDSLLGSHESLTSGAALCLKALIDSDHWRFAADEMVNRVCQNVSGALEEKSTQTNAHMGLVMALAKRNAKIVEPYARLWIQEGLRILNAGVVEGNSQKQLSAIQMANFLMRCLDPLSILSELELIIEEMEKCQSDQMAYVKGAAFEVLQTARRIGADKGSKLEFMKCEGDCTEEFAGNVYPTTPEDKKRNIIHSLCNPLSDSLLGSQESLTSGAALCLKALIDSDNWRFAADEMVNRVCQNVSGALEEKSTQTNAHMGLVMALAKRNATIVEPYARLWIQAGLRILNAGVVEGNSQKRLSAIQMVNFLMRCLDPLSILSELELIIEEMEKCQSDQMAYVKGAAFEVLQTARRIGADKGSKLEFMKCEGDCTEEFAGNVYSNTLRKRVRSLQDPSNVYSKSYEKRARRYRRLSFSDKGGPESVSSTDVIPVDADLQVSYEVVPENEAEIQMSTIKSARPKVAVKLLCGLTFALIAVAMALLWINDQGEGHEGYYPVPT
ncbi:uncharacterized protein LOC110769175 [Prunus avium]|uniref:Uncharacterized protein LOC110769175 n=1 Tax=Prunus avium TaxID=42229 RepID=A0A6P5TNV6_PRUAV|nr:uncharacterized protein LOC110769175 [Prunus avium]